MTVSATEDEFLLRRKAAAEKYRPAKVRLLLVAEAPPCTTSRHFYFEDVREQDSLFRYVCKGVTGSVSARERKADDLARLRDAGAYLIEASEDPIADNAKVRLTPAQLAALPARCAALKPEAVVLIKSNVFDLAYPALKEAGLNVVDVRMPFPGSGQQKKFETLFAQALEQAGFRA